MGSSRLIQPTGWGQQDRESQRKVKVPQPLPQRSTPRVQAALWPSLDVPSGHPGCGQRGLGSSACMSNGHTLGCSFRGDPHAPSELHVLNQLEWARDRWERMGNWAVSPDGSGGFGEGG